MKSGAHIVLLMYIIGVSGCSQSDRRPVPPSLTFHVSDSLVGPAVQDSLVGIHYRPPFGWREVSNAVIDSLLAARHVAPEEFNGKFPLLRSAFIDDSSGGVCMLTRIDSYDPARSEDMLRNLVGQRHLADTIASIVTAVFRTEEFRIQQIRTVSRDRIGFTMIFDDGTENVQPVFALDFSIPSGVYPSRARTIESVAGSIHRLTNP